MSLSKAVFGDFELYTIDTGDFKLDGGAMFGVVPKTLWSRYFDVDDKNRIPMTMRCLLVKSKNTGRVYLIDNGAGTKFNEKMENIYQLEHGSKNIENSLAEHGFSKDDITDIVFTHLHFDHCGGTTQYDKDGNLELCFPKANYHINKRHWETATSPNSREKASFLPDNIGPLQQTENLNLVPDNMEYEPGFDTLVANGHTIGQQLPRISDGKKTIVFAADLIPTHVHVPLAWVMGYDMRPIDTLAEKAGFMDQAIENNWYLYLEHDIQREIIQLQKENGKYSVTKTLTLDEFQEQ